jgi:hypothetical protein
LSSVNILFEGYKVRKKNPKNEGDVTAGHATVNKILPEILTCNEPLLLHKVIILGVNISYLSVIIKVCITTRSYFRDRKMANGKTQVRLSIDLTVY